MIDERAIVRARTIGKRCRVDPFAVIAENVVLGDDIVIHPHVVIADGVHIGNGVEVFPGTYIGKTPKGVGATIRPISYESLVSIGPDCAIGPHAVIYYDVQIGSQTLLGEGASIREGGRIGDRCIISRYVTLNYHVHIGNDVKIMDMAHITGNTAIEDQVFVGAHVVMANDNALGKQGYQENAIRGPILRQGCAIGNGANLLPNLVIGENAVVAAQAMVTKNVLPGTVVAGVPAGIMHRPFISSSAYALS